jgi:hypothetical protein
MKALASLLFMTLLLLSGCSSSSSIVGAWDSGNGQYEFYADGTYADPRYPTLPRSQTTYKLQGNRLHLAIQEDFPGKQTTTSQEWTVKFISGDKMEINGNPWKRVR